MKRFKLNFIIHCLTILCSLIAVYGKEECAIIDSEIRPYSSSYLPFSVGPLTENEGTINSLVERGTFTEEQINTYQKTSAMRRMDLAIREVLGKVTNYERVARTKLYRPNQPSFSGVCNQWSSASSDPAINEIVNQINSIACGNAILTREEIKEIITAFYPPLETENYGNIPYLQGHGVGDIVNMPKWLQDYGSQVGVDDIWPEKLDTMALNQLSNGKTLIMDVTIGEEVWNHPVYKMKRCTQQPPPNTIAKFIAPELVNTGDFVLDSKMRILSKTDQYFYIYLGFTNDRTNPSKIDQGFIEHRKTLVRELKGIINDIAKRHKVVYQENVNFPDMNEISDPISLREVLRDYIKHNLNNGRFKLKEGITVEQVNNTFFYKTETEFLERDDSKNIKKKYYQYLIFRDKNNEIVDSRWITPAQDRPDFLWESQRLSEKPFSELPQQLKDLFELLSKCHQNGEFFAIRYLFLKEYIDNAQSDGRFDNKEQHFILDQAKDLDPKNLNKLKIKLNSFNKIEGSDILLKSLPAS